VSGDWGLTGTGEQSVTEAQLSRLVQLLGVVGADRVHHGDCINADWQAHCVARRLGLGVVRHPPDNPRWRAFCDFDEDRAPAPYLVRNHHIVLETRGLIALPLGFTEELRSGTWATVRYARSQGREVHVIWPNGNLGF